MKGRNLAAYPDAEIRTAMGHAVAIEGVRGWRIAKEKARHKIDVVVALAMACLACVRAQGDGTAVDMSGIVAAFEDITDGLRTRGGLVDDLPGDVDPPSRSELGLADPISIGFMDFPQNPRR